MNILNSAVAANKPAIEAPMVDFIGVKRKQGPNGCVSTMAEAEDVDA